MVERGPSAEIHRTIKLGDHPDYWDRHGILADPIGGNAVLEYGDRDIAAGRRHLDPPARLCRPGRQASRAQPRGKPRFSTRKSSSGRETDSPLEGSGFEPSVPLPRSSSIRALCAEIIGRSTDVFRRDREFDVSALQGRLSTSSQSQCSTDPGLIAGTWHRPLFLTRDRWFESTSLRHGVCLTGARHGLQGKGPAFPGGVSLDETREWDVLATSRLVLASFL